MTISNKTQSNKTPTKKGGNILASGGYGCVFSPSLICQGQRKRAKNKISKLMTEKHAISEYEEIVSIKSKLESIKDYENYFLIYDVTLCKPATLSESDLDNYTNKCRALPKDNITKANINEKLDNMLAINMPNGGLPVDDYMYEMGTFYKMYQLHVKLTTLLKKGIIPMNERHIYHGDIKDSNVLVSKEMETRLVDWGLSVEYIPFKDHTFPRTWRNRPFQFNVPFSVILFSDRFVEKYTAFLKDGGKPNIIELRPFIIDYITLWMKERGAGHYKFINEIMYVLFSPEMKVLSTDAKPKIVETQITMNYIIDYLVDVLVHFTKSGNIKNDLRDYLDNVFIQIADIWGFISVYFVFAEILFNNYNKLTEQELEIFNKLKYIFDKYLYKPRHEPIILNELYSDLNDLEVLLYNNIKRKNKRNKKNKFTKVKINTGYARGKTRKNNSSVSFKRKPKQRRFKNPFFMSLK